MPARLLPLAKSIAEIDWAIIASFILIHTNLAISSLAIGDNEINVDFNAAEASWFGTALTWTAIICRVLVALYRKTYEAMKVRQEEKRLELENEKLALEVEKAKRELEED